MIIMLYALLVMLTLLALAFIAMPLLPFALFASPSHISNSDSDLKTHKLGWFCLLAVPLFAAMVYIFLGNQRALSHYWLLQREAPAVRAELAGIHSTQQLIERLRAQLMQQPDSGRGWYLLSRLYLSTSAYHSAYLAALQAHQLQPHNADYSVALAKTSFLVNHNHLDQNMLILLRQVLLQQPERIDAMNLLALNAYGQGDYQQAVDYWEKLLAELPADSVDAQELLKMIGQAQKRIEKQVESY